MRGFESHSLRHTYECNQCLKALVFFMGRYRIVISGRMALIFSRNVWIEANTGISDVIFGRSGSAPLLWSLQHEK